jgi:hypothetical protein
MTDVLCKVFNLLRARRDLFCLRTQVVPRSKYTLCRLKTQSVTDMRAKVAICSVIHTKRHKFAPLAERKICEGCYVN